MQVQPLLKFAQGNGKLPPSTLIFSLPAGYTCPQAKHCRSWSDRDTGEIHDGPATLTRCFAASLEALFPDARACHWHNYKLLQAAKDPQAMAQLITDSLRPHLQRRRRNPARIIRRIRIHESGDFYSAAYLNAWIQVAREHPDLIFYAYSKSLQLLLDQRDQMPGNMIVTASAGGEQDHLLDQFERKAYIVFYPEVAEMLGLPIDHDDTHAHLLPAGSFAHLVHGVQPPGSEAGAAIKKRAQTGEFVGYGKTFARVA